MAISDAQITAYANTWQAKGGPSTDTSVNAFDRFANLLQGYGLDKPEVNALIQRAAKEEWDATTFMQELRKTDAYAKRFPAMAQRATKRLDPIDEHQYITWEASARNILQTSGIPSEFMGDDEVTSLIAGNVSVPELQSRIYDGINAVQNADPGVKDALFRYYGVTPGHLAAYMLDPTKGTKLIQQQVAAAQIGGGATTGGYGDITQTEADRLRAQGLNPTQASTAFAGLKGEEQLFGALPGEAPMANMTREEQLASLTGGASATELERRARQRKAQFAGGGGFATGAQGVSGLAAGTE